MKDKKQADFNRRVYEYIDDDGHRYFSFHETEHIIGRPTRLKLRNRRGVHLIPFVSQLRAMSDRAEVDDDFDLGG